MGRMLLAGLSALLLPCLPERYRTRWPWPSPASPAVLAHISAYFHTVVSTCAWMAGFILYEQAYAERVTAMIASDQGTGKVGPITWYGLVCFFSYFFSLRGILLTAWVGDSVFRLIHVLGTGEALGSLFLSAPLWVVDRIMDRVREAKMTTLFGPASAPDRVSVEGESLVVRSNRPHSTWNALYSFSYGEKLYKLKQACEAPEGAGLCHLYRMVPWPETEIVRRVVRLDEVQPHPHTAPREGESSAETATGEPGPGS